MRAFDVAIVGGGPAGLSAALVLARAGRRAVVIDAGPPRNQASPGVRGFLSRDGVLPADLRAISRAQIDAYRVTTFLEARAQSVKCRAEGGFEVRTDRRGAVKAPFVLLAVGMVDILPTIPGFQQLWGRDIIHCAFCHGSEHRDRAWGVIAKSSQDVRNAHRFLNWTENLVVYAAPALSIAEETTRRLGQLGIRVVRDSVKGLLTNGFGGLVAIRLAGGSKVPTDTLVYHPEQRQTQLVQQSGIELADDRARVGDGGATSVPGVFAAGDLTAGHQDAASAVAAGAGTAKTITHLLGDRRCSPAEPPVSSAA